MAQDLQKRFDQRLPDAQEQIAGLKAKYAVMNVGDIKIRLADLLRIGADTYLETAIAYLALREKGERLLALEGSPLIHHLQHIAEGTLLADVLVKFGYSRELVRRIGSLPPSAQQHLCETGQLEAVVVLENDKTDVRVVLLSEIQPKQIAQVFASDHLRSIAEQKNWLDQRRRDSQEIPSTIAEVGIDKERLGAMVPKRMFLPLSDLLAIVAALKRQAKRNR